MRDLLVFGLVVGLALIALARPWVGVMLWNWISIMNPHRYAWGFAYSMPVAMFAGVSTLIGLLFTTDKQSPFKGAPVWWLLFFFIWMTLSWAMGYDPVGDYWMWDRSMKIFVMAFVALALLSNRYHIMAFVWVTAGSLAILGAKGGVFTILTAGNYRVWGPAGSFIEGNNEIALALIMTLPLLHFLQLQMSSKLARHGMSAVMLLCAAAALGSHSRGAFIALIVMLGLFWWRSERKGLISFLILIGAIALLPMLPEHWWERMATIKTYQEDGSAMGRINAWIVAWEVAKDYVTGAGMSYQHQLFFNIYGVHETIVRAAHSIYFEILGNHGWVGLILFLGLWFSTYWNAGWLRRNARKIPEAKWLADLGAMVQVGLVGYAAGGAFLSLAYFDLPYNMMIMVVLGRKWVETRGWERDPKMPWLEYLGLRRAPKAAAQQGPQLPQAVKSGYR